MSHGAKTMIPVRDRDAVLQELAAMRARDTRWRDGRVFSLVYHAGDAHEQLLKDAHAMYASANLLNPMAFPSLARMEREIIEIAGRLFHAAGAVGTVTSGGTESILCAVAAYRDRARRERPWIRSPELVVPTTIHPAFDKAAHYLGVKLVKVALRDDLRADPRAMARAITWRTIGMCASAPQYPHGVVDPIAELGAIAQKKKIPLHVDACVGGWMLPWLEQLGRPVPLWDFRVPGVTSISADLHKYAYAGKGASTLVWRSMDQMKYQIFVATDFPGGIYASPTMIGTRPGGPIAAAWAALHALGDEGYLALAKTAADTADRLRAGIRELGLDVLGGAGDATIVTWAAPSAGRKGDKLDVYAVADRMESRGWTIDRQHRPATIHLTVTANHAGIVDPYLADLRASLDEVRRDPRLAKSGSAPMYGMAAKMPVRGLVARKVRGLIADMYARTSAQHLAEARAAGPR
ncbi:MAG: aminotransferase class V-fold PLP-dependent enzyme [Proteobacteria bacterium]|nr:aminotransferase class V-fold PLP-dependent enzyme [Pseudomonadota bacterium]